MSEKGECDLQMRYGDENEDTLRAKDGDKKTEKYTMRKKR